MLGLMYLGAAALYLLLMWIVVRWAWLRGRGSGGSNLRGVSFAVFGFLLVYLPVFWDWIPTQMAHHDLCTRDAGFTALVTPRQWAERRSNLAAQLRGKDISASTPVGDVGDGFRRSVDLAGQRAWDRRVTQERIWGMQITRNETRLVAMDTGEVLAHSVDYHRYSNAFWLNLPSCFSGIDTPIHRLVDYSRQMKEEIK